MPVFIYYDINCYTTIRRHYIIFTYKMFMSNKRQCAEDHSVRTIAWK